MARIVKPSPLCPIHGMPQDRAACRGCNAAYMRMYLWRRRQNEPDRELWRRAKKRAHRYGIPFDLPEGDLIIPPSCPVLGIRLNSGGARSPGSPSLDRINPRLGYTRGNVRVISDRANRLKGARSLQELRACEAASSGPLRGEYRLIAEYVEREALLRDVRLKLEAKRPGWTEWMKVLIFLDKVFSQGHLVKENDDLLAYRNR